MERLTRQVLPNLPKQPYLGFGKAKAIVAIARIGCPGAMALLGDMEAVDAVSGHVTGLLVLDP